METKEFKVLLKEVVENRILIESLYKSLGVSEEKIKEHTKLIKPIVDDVFNKFYEEYKKENDI